MKKGIIGLSSFLLSLLSLLVPSLTSTFEAGALANDSSSSHASLKCRVLFPAISSSKDLDGYYAYTNGEAGGYYGELLKHLSDLGAISMEYVVPSSLEEWSSEFSSFMDGSNTSNIDLLTNCSVTGLAASYPNYAEVLTLSTRNDIKNPVYLLTQETNSSISEFDLVTYSGAKVGLTKSAKARNTAFYTWSENNAVYFGEGDSRNLLDVIVYDTAVLRDEAFKNGDIDIIVGPIMEDENEIETRTLASITSLDSCLAVRKDRTDLYQTLDASLIKIHDEGESYLNDLQEKYFPTHYDKIILNNSEISYVDKVSSFSIAYEQDFFPFLYHDNGVIKGFLPSYMAFFSSYIEEHYGTSFVSSFVGPNSYSEESKKKLANGDIGLWWGRSSLHEDDDYPLIDSDSYLSFEASYIANRNALKPLDEYKKIGVSMEHLIEGAEERVEKGELISYSDPESLLNDVNTRKIEAALTAFPYFKYARDHLRMDNLVYSGSEFTTSLVFSSSSTNEPLHGLLNKLIHYMNSSSMSDSIYQDSYEDYTYKVLSTDIIKNNLVAFISIAVAIVVVLLVMVLVLFLLFHNRKKRASELKVLSENDPLTGVYNKKMVIDEMNRRINAALPFSFYILDLNDFKSINDSYGHLEGDEVLKEMAIRFKKLSDQLAAFIGRFGGDEFAFIYDGTDEASVFTFSKLVLGTADKKVSVRGEAKVHVGLSLGAAAYPSDALDSDSLIKAADDALYSVKDKKIGGYSVYSHKEEYKETRRSYIKNLIDEAISEDKIYLLYQPLVDIRTMKAIGFESLMRMRGYEKDCPPSLFIPIAESTGLVKELGEIALKKSFAFGSHLKDLGIKASISINISAVQAEDPLLENNIVRYLGLYPNVSYSDFVFELTERLLFNKPISEDDLSFIKKNHVNLSLDDFGTGYSSLNSLTRFPFKYIKFDKSLIDEIGKEKNLDKLFEYVHGFGYKIVSEGVEEVGQVEYLKKVGCELIQGYYFSKPLEEEDAISFYKKMNG